MGSVNKMRAAAYLRVSTRQQNEDTQLPDLLKQIEIDNGILKDEYIFRDKISGLKDKTERKDLNRLLELTRNEIDIVYIWEISRLSRNPIYFDELINEFRKKRINICFLKPSPLYLYDINTNEENLTSSIVLSIFSKFALFEIEQKNQRSIRGKKEAINTRGETYAYKAPYGYKIENKFLVINDTDIVSEIEGYRTEKEVIESIFKMYASGKSLTQIINTLNDYKIRTHSVNYYKTDIVVFNKVEFNKNDIKWGRGAIHGIISNTVYCGYKDTHINIKKYDNNNMQIVKTETKRIETPPIISEELFRKVQEQKKKNIKIANKTYKKEYLLRGILKCGLCGNMYLGGATRGINKYLCADRTHSKANTYLGCRNIVIDAAITESVICDAVKSYYLTKMKNDTKETNIQTLIDEKNTYRNEIRIKTDNIKEYDKQIERMTSRIKLLDNADSLINEINNVNKNKERLESEITIIKDKIEVINSKIKAIENISIDKIKVDNIDNNFPLKVEALKELLEVILLFKYNDHIVIFQIQFKAGIILNIIYDRKKNAYFKANDTLYKLNTESLLFGSQTLAMNSTPDKLFDPDFNTTYYTPEKILEDNQTIYVNIIENERIIDKDGDILTIEQTLKIEKDKGINYISKKKRK